MWSKKYVGVKKYSWRSRPALPALSASLCVAQNHCNPFIHPYLSSAVRLDVEKSLAIADVQSKLIGTVKVIGNADLSFLYCSKDVKKITFYSGLQLIFSSVKENFDMFKSLASICSAKLCIKAGNKEKSLKAQKNLPNSNSISFLTGLICTKTKV